MTILFLFLGLVCGTAVALLLNKLLAGKIENKNYRRGLKVSAFVVCIVLGLLFALFGSMRLSMGSFIEGRVQFIETKLVEAFPNSNILETGIEADELASVADTLWETATEIETGGDTLFEKIIFRVFLKKLTVYAHAAEGGISTVAMMRDENGLVTIKSVLHYLKDAASKTIAPFLAIGQIAILILLLVYIGIYGGIAIGMKKSASMYNKSIVYGDTQSGKNDKTPQHE